jgi:hypothetical protein
MYLIDSHTEYFRASSLSTIDASVLNADSYLELEFSGFSEWKDFSSMSNFDRVEHMIDNIWRVYFAEWNNSFIFSALLDHIGSESVVPMVEWSHLCPASADRNGFEIQRNNMFFKSSRSMS